MNNLTSKEVFFQQKLVPAGQLLELALAILADPTNSGPHIQRSRMAFEALNLASCYALNPDNRILDSLGLAIDGFIATLAGVVSYTGSRDYDSAQDKFRLELNLHCRTIFDDIGYEPENRSRWLEEQLRTLTPVTANNRISKWRTFVRNCAWTEALRHVTGPRVALVESLRAQLSTRIGTQLAPVLWAATFRAQPDVEGLVTALEQVANLKQTAALVTEPVLEKKTSTIATLNPLPAGISVGMAAQGHLTVRAHISSSGQMAQDRVVALALAGTAWHALKAQLTTAEFLVECDVSTLASSVQAAEHWLAARGIEASKAIDQYISAQRAQSMDAIKEKLGSVFTAQELVLLRELFASAP